MRNTIPVSNLNSFNSTYEVFTFLIFKDVQVTSSNSAVYIKNPIFIVDALIDVVTCTSFKDDHIRFAERKSTIKLEPLSNL